MKKALENGYSIIRISQEDIWYDKYDWKNDTINCICNFINLYKIPTVFYLSNNKKLYNNYKIIMNDMRIIWKILEIKLEKYTIDQILNYL